MQIIVCTGDISHLSICSLNTSSAKKKGIDKQNGPTEITSFCAIHKIMK